jgi:hypothetical protein
VGTRQHRELVKNLAAVEDIRLVEARDDGLLESVKRRSKR